MSIEQLDLLLCDTYQMDAWFPFGWKWNKDFMFSVAADISTDVLDLLHAMK